MSAAALNQIINMSSDSFPGLEDLQEHLEPALLDDACKAHCGLPLTVVKPPPGLGDLCDDQLEPKWVLPGGLVASEEATTANDAEQAVAALLEAERRLLKEEPEASDASAAEGALLATLLGTAIKNLRETAAGAPAVQRGSSLDDPLPQPPKELSDQAGSPLGGAAPPPGLRSALRSSAKPFAPTLSQQVDLPVQSQPLPAADGVRAHLMEAHAAVPGRVLVVRRIQRLGHDSAAKLRSYFEWYGPVEGVIAAPSHGRCQGPGGGGVRLRPAFVGYVMMATAQGARAALADGTSQNVEGVQIEVLGLEPEQHCLVPSGQFQ